ncbi:MAG: monovalent cation/H+ antiporter subunit D, partial [Phyllobacterium sp.]
SGLPPLSGFIAKLAILSALFNPDGLGSGGAIHGLVWTLVALLIFSGLSALIAMTRMGIRVFWAPIEGTVPRVLVMEIVPVVVLLVLCLQIVIQAGPIMHYMNETAQSLYEPQNYTRAVLSAPRAGGSEQ